MKRFVRRPFQSAILVAAMLIFAAACTTKKSTTAPAPGIANAACPTPQNIPSGFDYPQKATTVEGWVTSGNVARTRQHGWNMWAALNTMAGGKPIYTLSPTIGRTAA